MVILDVVRGFPSIQLESVALALPAEGLRGHVLQAYLRLMADFEVHLQTEPGSHARPYTLEVGTPQGSRLSPARFVSVMRGLNTAIREARAGLDVAGVHLPAVSFMDDNAGLAASRHRSLNLLYTCLDWGVDEALQHDLGDKMHVACFGAPPQEPLTVAYVPRQEADGRIATEAIFVGEVPVRSSVVFLGYHLGVDHFAVQLERADTIW